MADADALAPSDPLTPGFVPAPSLFQQAQQQWPRALGDVLYKETPRSGDAFLEAWPPGEPGTPDRPRPKEFPLGKYGIEVYDTEHTRPIDILGDVTSHFLINQDPRIKDYYEQFKASMTPEQLKHLHDQHGRAFRGGERRSFDAWAEAAGIPAWFRGYAFQQWPQEFTDRAYTPDQRAMFDEMMGYLGGR